MIKIDTQDHDLEVLKSAKNLLKDKKIGLIKVEVTFNSIYKSNHWNKSQKFNLNQSYSGPGSVANSIQTNNLISELEKFFKENNVKKILDAPCGDCAWISKIFDTNINYVGIDIVEDLMNENKLKFKSNLNVNFYCKDLAEYNDFDNFDFVLMRDFFIHFDSPY